MSNILDKVAIKLRMKRPGAAKTKDMDKDAATLVSIPDKIYKYALSIGDRETAQLARTTKVKIKRIYKECKKNNSDKILQYELPENGVVINGAPNKHTTQQFWGLSNKNVQKCFKDMIDLVVELIKTIHTKTDNMVKIFNIAYKISCKLGGEDAPTTDIKLPSIPEYDPEHANLENIPGLLSKSIC